MFFRNCVQDFSELFDFSKVGLYFRDKKKVTEWPHASEEVSGLKDGSMPKLRQRDLGFLKIRLSRAGQGLRPVREIRGLEG